MKVYSVSIAKTQNTLFSQKQSQAVTKQREKSNMGTTVCLIGGVLAAVVTAGVIVARTYKNGRPVTSTDGVQSIKSVFEK